MRNATKGPHVLLGSRSDVLHRLLTIRGTYNDKGDVLRGTSNPLKELCLSGEACGVRRFSAALDFGPGASRSRWGCRFRGRAEPD
jgi:hypothetical protein